MLLVPIFLAFFLLVRGTPVFLYRSRLTAVERTSFALYSSVASLSLVVVITEIGVVRPVSPRWLQCSWAQRSCPYCYSQRLRDSFFIDGTAGLSEAGGGLFASSTDQRRGHDCPRRHDGRGQHVGPKGNSILTPLEAGLLSTAAGLHQTKGQFRAGGVDR